VRKKKGKGRGEADRWGPLVSERKTKEKERRRCGLARGEDRWAAGPERLGGKLSLFFSFLFQTLFKSNFFLLNSNQNPSNLFTKFHKLFKSHTSNQKPCKAK
jgi:hypothetical protein